MDDYAEQQAMEIEALESIFMDDMQELTEGVPGDWKPTGKVYRAVIVPQTDDTAAENEYPVRVEVVYAHTPNYPDEAPLVKARSLQGLTDNDVAQLQGLIDDQIELNMGLPMIYTLIGAAQEWVNDKALALSGPTIDPVAERKRLEEAEEARIAELRAHGTAVTPETFAAWKAKFDAERALSKSGLNSAAEDGRLSGKRWFLQQEELHNPIQEPELEDDETDGEGSRSDWTGEDEEESDLEDSDVSDDEDFY